MHSLSPFISLSSSSSTPSITEQEEEEDDSSSLASPPSSLAESLLDDNDGVGPSSGCKGCGKEQIERGCNGEGRIQGGIATIPGFGWWPIKAYRPCPGFLASGGNYRRRGQSMDEVAFGGGKRGTSMDDLDELEARKKGQDRRRFKS